MQVSALQDHDLIKLYLAGDQKAFEILLERHKDKIYTSIYLFVKDTALAEDIFQEVFIKIINTLREGKYNHEGKFIQWALRISYNMCVDYFRRNKRRANISPTESFDIFDILPQNDLNIEQSIIRDEMHDKLRRVIDGLQPDQERL